MRPVETFDAQRAYSSGKRVYALDRRTGELTDLKTITNRNAILNEFTKAENLFYVSSERSE